jgi:hypothetical protein
VHRRICGVSPSSDTNTLDAILFPADAAQPRIVKLPWKMVDDEDSGVRWMRVDMDSWFSSLPKEARSSIIRKRIIPTEFD